VSTTAINQNDVEVTQVSVRSQSHYYGIDALKHD
jgi:hypothetical protein